MTLVLVFTSIDKNSGYIFEFDSNNVNESYLISISFSSTWSWVISKSSHHVFVLDFFCAKHFLDSPQVRKMFSRQQFFQLLVSMIITLKLQLREVLNLKIKASRKQSSTSTSFICIVCFPLYLLIVRLFLHWKKQLKKTVLFSIKQTAQPFTTLYFWHNYF